MVDGGCWNTRSYIWGILVFWSLLYGGRLSRRLEGENCTSGPRPYQPYEAEVTNSPISNRGVVGEREREGGRE